MAIDRGDYHYDSAGSWDRACNHIAMFLWWAAERGLASDDHDAKAIAKKPTKYFIAACDTKLWEDDLTARGNAFATYGYTDYLKALEAYAKKLKIGDYDVGINAKTKAHFFAVLDAGLAQFDKPATKKPAAKKRKKPAAKKKKKPTAKKKKK